jgi:hypothetical protein
MKIAVGRPSRPERNARAYSVTNTTGQLTTTAHAVNATVAGPEGDDRGSARHGTFGSISLTP